MFGAVFRFKLKAGILDFFSQSGKRNFILRDIIIK